MTNLQTIWLRPLDEAPKDGTVIGLVGKFDEGEPGVIDFAVYGKFADGGEAWFPADGGVFICHPDGLDSNGYFGWFPLPKCEAPE